MNEKYTEERKKILAMLEEGKINSQEAMDLLDALKEDEAIVFKKKKEESKKMVRIRIKSEDGDKVNVNLPIGLIKAGLKIGSKFDEKLDIEGVDFDEIMELIDEGHEGKIVDIQSEDGDIVEIYVD